MDKRRDEPVYRKINQLTALLIAGGAILALLVGIVAILVHGRLDRSERAVTELQQRLTQIERRQAEEAAAQGPSAKPTTSEPSISQPTAAKPQLNRSRVRHLMDRLTKLPPEDAEAERIAGELDRIFGQGEPMAAPILARIARAELSAKRLESALVWAGRALDDDLNELTALVTAAEAAYGLSQLEQVGSFLERALAHPDVDAPTQLFAGRVYQTLGAVDKAGTALQAAKQSPATAAEAALLLARMAFEDGRLGDASAELDYCDAAEAERPDALRLRAQVALARRDYSTCRDATARLLDRNPNDDDARALLGEALLGEGRPREAAAELERLADRQPLNARIWYLWGTARLRLLDPQQAAEFLGRAVQLDETLVMGWQHLGVARANLDDCPAALEAFGRAIELDGALAEAHFGRAVCLARLGEIEAAREALDRAIRIDASYAERARAVPGLVEVGDAATTKRAS
ncbi:MAG: tetratricopeptide repeat protein [bacterium]|nr:tetratricopeptide repeat protein [bacterium]